MKNKYTKIALLKTEASVEDLIVGRLIRDIGYDDTQIKHKESIPVSTISVGSKKQKYRPDYILSTSGTPRIVVDAKSPGENIYDWIGQCVSYCATINRSFKDNNPVKYFLLSNGIKTAVFSVDHAAPLVELDFSDLKNTNKKYKKIINLLSPANVCSEKIGKTKEHEFKKLSIEEINAVFAWCHQHIYKKDNLSQAAGFEQFVKIIFLKLISDRQIKDRFGLLIEDNKFAVPSDAVKFSVAWIEAREEDDPSPLDTVQFRGLVIDLENEIRKGNRKRIFPENSRIALRAETIKEVVRKLEHAYLFGIDADLNGRLFETFLSATMRGKDLGQFFTPRSVAKLGTLLADPYVDKEHYDVVLDGCCGTGGFLIDALAQMWAKIDSNPTMSASDKERRRRDVAMGAIIGIDIAQEPNLARLARMNMYLHGDGGASIYEADFLDKCFSDPSHSSVEVRAEVGQLKAFLQKRETGVIDVVITNPPFAKVYERKTKRETNILNEYEIALGE